MNARQTAHLSWRLQQRHLDVAWVTATIEEPDWVEPDPNHPGRIRHFKHIAAADNRVLRVVLDQQTKTDKSREQTGPRELAIITAFFDRGARRRLARGDLL